MLSEQRSQLGFIPTYGTHNFNISLQIELETLNTATDEINKLEIELEVNYNNKAII